MVILHITKGCQGKLEDIFTLIHYLTYLMYTAWNVIKSTYAKDLLQNI